MNSTAPGWRTVKKQVSRPVSGVDQVGTIMGMGWSGPAWVGEPTGLVTRSFWVSQSESTHPPTLVEHKRPMKAGRLPTRSTPAVLVSCNDERVEEVEWVK